MIAKIESYPWSDKQQIHRDAVFIGILLGLIALLFVKFKPYFTQHPKVVSFTESKRSDQQAAATGGLLKYLLNTQIGNSQNQALGHARYSSSAQPIAQSSRVYERPLFSAGTVSLRAVLTQGFSTSQSDDTSEARVIGFVAEGSSLGAASDYSAVDGATLTGKATPNFSQKRIQFQFSELITRAGQKYTIAAVSIDPETKSIGTPAHYSSGIASRLVGAGLGKIISTGGQLARSRVLENTAHSDPITQALNHQAVDTSGQATNDLGQEVTRDLRETRPELDLPAGTEIFIRLKAVNREGVK